MCDLPTVTSPPPSLPTCSSVSNPTSSDKPPGSTPPIASDTPPDGLVIAQRLAIRVAEQITREVKPGETEKQIVERADKLILSLGGVGVWTPTVVGFGIGTLSCFPTDVPSERPLWNIDLGHVDVHPVTQDGWWGDCTRTLHIGGNKPQGFAFEAIQKIHSHILSSAYVGMRACDLFVIFEKALSEWGCGMLLLDRLQNIGHSLDQNSSYDAGYLDGYNETVLRGAWAVEPFVGNHLYGVKMEDVLWFGDSKVTIVK